MGPGQNPRSQFTRQLSVKGSDHFIYAHFIYGFHLWVGPLHLHFISLNLQEISYSQWFASP
jgi:hypothetical protein